MWQSIKEYTRAVLHWWWIVLIGVVSGGAGLILDIFTRLTIPYWAWAVVLLLGLMVAQFLALHTTRLERDRLEQRSRPCLRIEATTSWNYGQSGQSLGLRIRNQGTDRADDCRGHLVEIAFASPPHDVTLSQFPVSHPLQWSVELPGTIGDAFSIPGSGTAVLEILYWELVSRTPAISCVYISYVGSQEFRRNHSIQFEWGGILLVISVTSQHAMPIYAICLADKDASGFGYRLELLGVDSQCPTTNGCRRMLVSHIGESGNQ